MGKGDEEETFPYSTHCFRRWIRVTEGLEQLFLELSQTGGDKCLAFGRVSGTDFFKHTVALLLLSVVSALGTVSVYLNDH